MYNFTSYGMNSFPGNITFIFLLIAIWSILWKGYAMWHAAKNNRKGWFVTLLILNTVGILEIIFIFGVLKKKWVDVRKDFERAISSHK